MNWKIFIAGVVAGAAAGHVINHYLLEPKTISGDVILENVKEAFKQEGPIEGSWIQLKKQHYKKFAMDTFVYHAESQPSVTANANNSSSSQTQRPERLSMST